MKKLILLFALFSNSVHAMKFQSDESQLMMDGGSGGGGQVDSRPQTFPTEPEAPAAPPTVVTTEGPAPLPVWLGADIHGSMYAPATPTSNNPSANAINNQTATFYGYMNDRYDYEGLPDVSVTQNPPDLASIAAKYPGVDISDPYFLKRLLENGAGFHDNISRCQHGDFCGATIAMSQDDYARNIYDPNGSGLCNSQTTVEAIKACIAMADEMTKAVVGTLSKESQVQNLIKQTSATQYSNGWSEANFSYQFTGELAGLQAQRNQVSVSQTCVNGEVVTIGGLLDTKIVDEKIAALKSKIASHGWEYTDVPSSEKRADLNCAQFQASSSDPQNTIQNISPTNGTNQNTKEGSVRDMVALASLDATMATVSKYNCQGSSKPEDCKIYDSYAKEIIPATIDSICKTDACRSRYESYREAALALKEGSVSPAVGSAISQGGSSTIIDPMKASRVADMSRTFQASLSNITSNVNRAGNVLKPDQVKSLQAGFIQNSLCQSKESSCVQVASAISARALDLNVPQKEFTRKPVLPKTKAVSKIKIVADYQALKRSISSSQVKSPSVAPMFMSRTGRIVSTPTVAAIPKATVIQNSAAARAVAPAATYTASRTAPGTITGPRDAMDEADEAVVMENLDRSKSQYNSAEEDLLFEKVSKAYVRNLDKVLKKKKVSDE